MMQGNSLPSRRIKRCCRLTILQCMRDTEPPNAKKKRTLRAQCIDTSRVLFKDGLERDIIKLKVIQPSAIRSVESLCNHEAMMTLMLEIVQTRDSCGKHCFREHCCRHFPIVMWEGNLNHSVSRRLQIALLLHLTCDATSRGTQQWATSWLDKKSEDKKVPWSEFLVLGMVTPPFIGNPYNGYINP